MGSDVGRSEPHAVGRLGDLAVFPNRRHHLLQLAFTLTLFLWES